MHHGPLDVVQVGVVLQRPLQEARLLAQLGHVGPVVVSEHLVPEDRICHLQREERTDSAHGLLQCGSCRSPPPRRDVGWVYLRGVYEVHLQQARLQVALGGAVVLQGVQQERGALLDQTALHEHVHYLPKGVGKGERAAQSRGGR